MCVNRLFAAGKTEKQPDHDSKYDTECQEIAGKRCINCKKEGATGDDDEDSLPVPAHGQFVVVDAGMRFIAALHSCAPCYAHHTAVTASKPQKNWPQMNADNADNFSSLLS